MLIRLWALGLVRLFFPVRAISGAGNVPATGPVIVVANHPNGLLDPLVVRLGLGRPVGFLAKSTFWDTAFFRACMEAFGALPVFRPQEADASRNAETFARAGVILAAGGWLALFPEGTSHDGTVLQPMKTGAARIALDAGVPVTILPVGLCFADKDVFRSAVALAVGVPFVVEPGSSGDRAAVDALTDRIGEALGEVVLQAEDAVVWRAMLAVAFWTGVTELSAREARARQLAARWRVLLADDPAAAEQIAAEVRSFSRMLGALGVEDPFAIEVAAPREVVAGLWSLLALAPVAVVGAVLAWIPYRLVRPLAWKAAGGAQDIVGTAKLLVGSLVLGATYVAWAIAAAGTQAPDPVRTSAALFAALVLGPLTGLGALVFDERLSLRRQALRGIAVRLFRPQVALAVAARRRELVSTVEAALGKG